jgi:serine/threonine protein kinase
MGLELEGRAPPRLGGGRFVVVDALGDGGTASVYLSWDNAESRWCALKALHHKYLRDEDMRRRFAQEAQALAQLQHENIPALYYHDDDASPPFLVMELARCGSTMDWLKEHGPMPPSMAADVVFQVCQALAEAHAAGIVHRDVKPHNFLLDDHGRCRLTDFGIARLTETTSFTATGSQIGTFSFMAPEQRSDTKSVDLRADVYSVGASLYTLLTARTSAELFVADQDDALLEAVPIAFRGVIIRATRYKPDERYASVLELQTDLMNALSRIPPEQTGYPPLVLPRDPLPKGPPKSLAPGPVRARAESPPEVDRRKPAPYRMTRTSDEGQLRSAVGRAAAEWSSPQGLPSYIAQSEIASIERAEGAATQQRQRDLVAADEAARARVAASTPSDAAGVERWLVPVVVTLGVVALVLVGFLGYGTWQVRTARHLALAEADHFVDVLMDDANVVYELGGDRRVFEELYQRATDERNPAHMSSAVAFMTQVDALSATHVLTSETEPRIRRLQGARTQYLSATEAWRLRSSSPSGAAAVSVGFATPPR